VPIVTSLKPQRNGKRVNVYVDEEFAFGIDLDNLVKFGIKINRNFTPEELNTIIKKAELQKIFDNLIRFASMRPSSTKEISMWFYRKQTPPTIQEELKEKLIKLGFLDDFAFAKWWIEQRQTFKPRGKKFLVLELRQKGIDQDTITSLIEESGINEELIAKKLLQKNPKNPQSYLARKGISWDIIRKLTIDTHSE
jgi:regulatory protein